jgi:hypothetical protein
MYTPGIFKTKQKCIKETAVENCVIFAMFLLRSIYWIYSVCQMTLQQSFFFLPKLGKLNVRQLELRLWFA